MRELTKRIVGAASASSRPPVIWAGTMSRPLSPAARFISSMTRAVPSLPYRVAMACSTARRVAIMGTICLRDADFSSS